MSTLSPISSDYEIAVSEEHEAFRKAVREFAEKEVAPVTQKIDRENQMDMRLVKRAAELGLFGIPFPEEYGGGNGDDLSLVLATEEIARFSAAFSAVVGATYLVSTPIFLFGNEEQKRKYLVPIAKGEKLAAHAMTEPGTGSDVAAIKTNAQKKGDRYVINGKKMFITNGDKADLFLIFARTSPIEGIKRHQGVTAFIAEKGMSGLTVGQRTDVIGLRGDQPVELVMDNLEVPETNIVGEIGRGVRIALTCYDHGRVGVAAQGTGLAQAALEAALNYSTQRQTFDNFLLSYQQVQFKIAEMTAAVHTARLLTYWAATLTKKGKDFIKASSIAKIMATEAAEKNAHMAMLIMGAAGVSTDMQVERILRDSQIIKTYEGTNDIQRLTIMKEVAKEMGVVG
ncbi:MAG TPA: acyl-CoA dehydrogenase family protein [Nitrososphaerales archaeon]|nr:acyl-CoA dehydrogenase family protein [Nitrososphaerales archaeon]